MSEDITSVKLKFSCQENWDAMQPIEGGRNCDRCQKKVYDFSNSKADEFRRILAENNNNVCGRFTPGQMATKSFPFWKKWASAAMLLIGFNIFSGKADAQTKSTKQKNSEIIFPPPSTLIGDVEILPIQDKNGAIFTAVDTYPEFPGGDDALKAFLNKNIHPQKNIKGRVILNFIVEKNGTLTNVKILKSLNNDADKEAIKAIKFSPKWSPGIEKGKIVRTVFTIPVEFK